jgi:putative ATP-dependent endonuclease of OLD family
LKLVAFAVKNYRSIQSTPRIELSDLTVLVGPNNEGKSNLLSALVCALSLAQDRNVGVRRTLLGSSSAYDYERDFPVGMREGAKRSVTKFELEFELDATDQVAFRAAVGSKLNGTLPIELSVDKEGTIAFDVKKQGPVKKALSAKRPAIGKFIAERLQFQYIEAVRDEAKSKAIVESMVTRALAKLEQDPAYQQALKAIEDAERPVFTEVSNLVHASLKPFIGALRGVSTEVGREQRTRAMRRSAEIWLDDGTLTPLSQKGDGVKSLVAIALAKASAEGSAGDRNLILAIEEPEAHLHSGAVHTLRALLEDIALTRQVIISTHEPALVRRDYVGANVLVKGNKAKPASSLEEVRKVLGVQLAENLASPDFVVLVEGLGDARLLTEYIRAREPKLAKSVGGGRLRFTALNGAANLPHLLRFYQALVCSPIAFVDNDSEGNAALEKARKDGLLDTGAEFCAGKPGLVESELEDLLDPGLYAADLCQHLGIPSLKPKSAKFSKQKWSERLAAALLENGKPKADLDRLLREAKFKTNELAVANAGTCFVPALVGPVDGLMMFLKAKLGIEDRPPA